MPPRKRAASAPKPETEETAELVAENDDDAPADIVEAKPERSDLQPVDDPCPECFPGGWPEQSFAVGCTHGTWKRD